MAAASAPSSPRVASLSEVIADAPHVYLAGRGIASVDAQGKLVHTTADANLDAAAIYKNSVVGLNDAAAKLELLGPRRRVTASMPLNDLGGELAVSGDNA